MPDRQFSVLIATYKRDDPGDLSRALRSVIDQTVRPDEIVVVADGSLTTDLEAVLDDFESAYPGLFIQTSLPTNQGLGAALNHGVDTCSHEWIGRMDSDDIAVENRFERQLAYLDDNPETDVLGGYIGEFSDDSGNIETLREVPTTSDQIRSTARFRCPLNHPTVMFRRSAVLEVGNYRSLRSMQDYDLWMRMLANEHQLSNIPTILVKCEGGKELFNRRGGLTYAWIETKLQYEFLRLGMISVPVFVLNICVRIPLRLIPNRLRSLVYRSLLRN